MKRFVMAIALLWSQELAGQTILYVDGSASGANNGSSWSNAYTSLQTALEAAVSGTQIWVARGTYKPSSENGVTTGGPRYYHYRMKNGVAIYGGFAGTETALTQRSLYAPGEANETILSGDVGTPGDNSDNCYHVFYHPPSLGLCGTAVLDGFTITEGNANHFSFPYCGGGGMYNENCSPSVRNCCFAGNAGLAGGAVYDKGTSVFTNCTFTANDATYGGAIYHTGDCAYLLQTLDCRFSENTAGTGGGIYNLGATLYVNDCLFDSNAVTNDGGGLYNDNTCTFSIDNSAFTSNSAHNGGAICNKNDASPAVSNCTFTSNRASSGGGVYNESSSPSFVKCSFSGNSVFADGGGMFNTSSSSPTLDSCTFTGNLSGYGGGMFNAASSPSLTRCTFTKNRSAVKGGGLYNDHSYPGVINSLFTKNSAGEGGGALYHLNSGGGLTNCTLTENSADYGGGMSSYDSSPTLRNCIIWGNEAATEGDELKIVGNPGGTSYSTTLSYCCYGNQAGDIAWSGGYFLTGNCTTSDPRMLRDYRLFRFSPCVDAGNDTYNSESKDIRGKLRHQGSAIDMGVFEWTAGTDPEGSVFFVNSAASSGANTGVSWTDAYTSLQSALDIAVSGCQIWVARGTYYPSSGYDLVDASGDSTRYYHFRLMNGVALYGGFSGGETLLSQRNIAANPTTLSGDIGIPGVRTDNCYHVLYNPPQRPAIDTSSVLDGFTITEGNASGDARGYHYAGGGMVNDSASPSVSNCTFRSNTAATHGGGMYNCSSSPSVTNCLFTLNAACYGGGMKNTAASPRVTSCTFTVNTAYESGGGMDNESSASPRLTNCTFTRDSSYIYGGAMATMGSSASMTNCLFALNRSGYGGAFYQLQASATLTNCTITQNRADYYGGAASNFFSSMTVNNSIIWGNAADEAAHEFYTGLDTIRLSYSCYAHQAGDILDTASTLTADTHCITGDPVFVGASINPAHPYSLMGLSPCVDAGNNASTSQSCDIRGSVYPRALDKVTGAAGRVDMGAYEYRVTTDPLPVELASFAAESKTTGVVLKWQTATEVNCAGFDVERRCASSEWKKAGFVQGGGTTNAPRSYSFRDVKLAAGSYEYRLKQLDQSGSFTYSRSLIIELGAPNAFALRQNYPNPFNPVTTIGFDIPGGTNARVSLRVFDTIGREVAMLVDEIKAPGSYDVQFDGSKLASGIYFYRLHTDSFSAVRSLIVVK